MEQQIDQQFLEDLLLHHLESVVQGNSFGQPALLPRLTGFFHNSAYKDLAALSPSGEFHSEELKLKTLLPNNVLAICASCTVVIDKITYAIKVFSTGATSGIFEPAKEAGPDYIKAHGDKLTEYIKFNEDKLPHWLSTEPQPLHEVYNAKSLEEFRETGLLFHVNQILHPFGWALGLKIQKETNQLIGLEPARVRYRGFDHKSQSEQHIKIANYLAKNAPYFPEDIAETGPNNSDPEITD